MATLPSEMLERPRSESLSISGAPGIVEADNPSQLDFVEPVTGIEPAYSAWEADVLPLNYTGMVRTKDSNSVGVAGSAVGVDAGWGLPRGR